MAVPELAINNIKLSEINVAVAEIKTLKTQGQVFLKKNGSSIFFLTPVPQALEVLDQQV